MVLDVALGINARDNKWLKYELFKRRNIKNETWNRGGPVISRSFT